MKAKGPSLSHIKEDMKQETKIIKAAKEMKKDDKAYLAKSKRRGK